MTKRSLRLASVGALTLSATLLAPMAAHAVPLDAGVSVATAPVDTYASAGFYVYSGIVFDFDVTQLNGYAGGSAALNTAPSHGTAVINSDGTGTYTSAAGYLGDDEFTYTLLSADGSTLLHGTVQIEALEAPAPSRPGKAHTRAVRAITDAATVADGGSVSIDVLRNDRSSTGDALTITSASVDRGSVAIVGDKIVFTDTTSSQVGRRSETITYTVSDGVAIATGKVKVSELPHAVNGQNNSKGKGK